MSTVFKKLNLKQQTDIVVLQAPASFESELAQLAEVRIHRALDAVETVTFSLAFVMTQQEVDQIAAAVAAKAVGDATIWFAYPKGSSKRYSCEFNRDTGWQVLGTLGFEAVRQVAIDEDWSALRFRRTRYIKSMKRDLKHALSSEGKKRTAK